MTRAEPQPISIEIHIECDLWIEAEPATERLALAAARQALAHAGAAGGAAPGVTILLSDDGHVHELNRHYRGKDKPTNVLSFGAPKEFAGAPRLGDVVLAYETVAAEACAQDKSLAHHLQHLTVHGVLHLLGYDHDLPAEAARMEAAEHEILARLGVPDPYLTLT
jgi:probable rRNA maturation factor